MKIIRKKETQVFKNSGACTAIEYPMDDKDINGAVIELNGRYPDKGFAVNEISKEMAYVIEGSGKVVVENKEFVVENGDLVLINPNEQFYWEGKMTIFMPCAPAWSPDQYKILE